MQRPSTAAPFVITAGLLLETSVGSLCINITGADCPALSANFLNLCRAGFWNGAVVTEVIPEVAVFFTWEADPVYARLLRSVLCRTPAESIATTTNTTAAAANGNAARPSPRHVHQFWRLLPHHEADAETTAGKSDPPHGVTAAASLLSARQTSSSSPSLSTPASVAAAAAAVDPVAEQDGALAEAIEREVRLCKRRRCVGLKQQQQQPGRTVHAAVYTAASSACPSPCTVHQAGSLLVDVAAPTLRFGLTLTSRTMEFVDTQFVAIGHLADGGEAVLRRMQRAPFRERAATPFAASVVASAADGDGEARHDDDDVVCGRPASAWPHPVRLLRLKRAIVLPTAGTERCLLSPSPNARAATAASGIGGLAVASGAVSRAEALRQRQRVAAALHEAGCFNWWASPAAVRAAHRTLVQLVQQYHAQLRYVQPSRPETAEEAAVFLADSTQSPSRSHGPLVVLQNAATHAAVGRPVDASSAEVAAMLEVAANPHYSGAFLNSDDDDGDDVYYGSGGGAKPYGSAATQLSARQQEERRKSFMQQHQEKANETLSLMLNVLNGVADVSGDIKPPENVLFVCKLNPVTTGDGLALCFAQFGRVVSAEVIQDAKTKQSLCYGFVEFESVEACFRAFQKMDKALVDDCRIHVDFSQSVSKLWAQRQREMRKRGRPTEQ